MTKVNVPTSKMGKFEGKWVVIDPKKSAIIAYSDNLDEISPLVTRPASDTRQSGTVPYSFLVPRKNEGPYVLSE
ncbi:MAG: hypothetical protein M1484_05225 [Patescibacteria group bacterium]|nr:hypothetical protein [Patescibacteria group bacterium]MCL5432456.1 hypothetical protein [Patescibacteria group bacterium]